MTAPLPLPDAGSGRRGRALAAGLALVVVLGLAGTSLAWREGPPPDRVGACGFGLTCRDSGCHSTFPVGSATLAWDLHQDVPLPGPLPVAYVPGRTYDLRLDLVDSDLAVVIWGFELSPSIRCPTPRPAGTIVPADPVRTRTFVGDFGVEFLSHDCRCPSELPSCCGYVPEAAPGTNGWSFAWTAPARGSGLVWFDFAINAANWDAQPSGDRIVLGSVPFPEEACPPEVADLRVALVACDPGLPGVPHLDVRWTPTGGPTADVLRILTDPSQLGVLPRDAWPLASSSCLPLDVSPLVFLSAAGACELGSEGPH